MGQRMFLIGVACLFGLNFLQGSILGSVMAWSMLVLMIVGHCFAFLRETGQRYHNICLLLMYTGMFLWFGNEVLFFVLKAA